MEHEVTISHLRDCLGVAYLHVARTGEPVVVKRFGPTDVALVPLWEWRWLKAIEEAIRIGQIDASEFLQDRANANDSAIGETFDTDEEEDDDTDD